MRDERGVAMVLFAVMLPLLLIVGVISIDVGNWWVHKRHLQTQVDAGALASGPQFTGCFFDPVAADAAIASKALAYAGDTLRPGNLGPTATSTTTNQQVQEPNDVRVVLNSTRYWQSSDGTTTPTTGYGLDNSIGSACVHRSLDVKATDDQAPLLWGLVPVTASPKAHAKIEIRQLRSESGMLPWAVPEIDPRAVVALFVNENGGASPVIFDYQMLSPNLAYDANGDGDNNPATNPFPFSAWTTAAGQEQVTLGGANDNTGVIILVSKDNPNPTLSGTLASICGQSPGLVRCYGGTAQTDGLSFIHGYNGGGSGTVPNPIIRQVQLFPSGCDPQLDLSAAYFTLEGGCNAAVHAVIDFGVGGDPTNFPQCARVPGYTWVAGGIGGSEGHWEGSITLPTGGPRQVVNLSWTSGPRNASQCGNPSQQPNSGSFSKVAAAYIGNAASGPVKYLKLAATKANGTPMPDANSVERNDPGNQYYNYFVTVGLPVPLQVRPYTDPPLVLRMASPSGSQNQAFDCDKSVNFDQEIEIGCRTSYRVNYDDLDGDGDKEWRNINCNGYFTGNLPPSTFNPNPMPDCVMTETGDQTGNLRKGLNARFETPCVDNNWPDTPAEAAAFFGPNGYDFSSDPRYVTLIITDDTAFTGSGNEPLPIKYFAGFYVTGWDVGGQTSGCPDPDGGGPRKGNDCHPIYGCTYNNSKDNGDVWGYFVNIVVFSSTGDPSDSLCTFTSQPGVCLPVLVE